MVTAVEQARVGLCRMIASGELEAGQVLPSEAELCERFGVSRSSVREAQKMLSVAGVLSGRRGSRMTVSEMSADDIMRSLSMVIPLLPLDRFLELFTLREVLEGHCAAQAAARLSDDEVKRLRELARELADSEPGDRAQVLDAEFHALVIAGARDEVIAALLENLRKRGRDYRVFEELEHADLKVVSDQAHLALADAIAARDPESARFLAMEHVRTTRRWLEEFRPGPILFRDDYA